VRRQSEATTALWDCAKRGADERTAVRPKVDRQNVKLALQLRAETAVMLKWIAQRLYTGTWTHLNHLLYWARRGK